MSRMVDELTRALDRTPPQNTELELCVLGAIMLEPREAYEIASDILQPEDFYLDGHGLIFRLMGELMARGIPPDGVMVIDELRARDLLDQVGGTGVVMGMLNSIPTAANVEAHSLKLKDKSQQRRLLTSLLVVIEMIYDQQHASQELLDVLDSLLTKIENRDSADSNEHISAVLQRVMDQVSTRADEIKAMQEAGKPESSMLLGVPTGLPTLDRWTNGMQPGELWTVAALSSVGKSALALNILQRAAAQGHTVGMVSIEMTKESLAYRLLSAGVQIISGGSDVLNSTRIKAASDLTQREWYFLSHVYERQLKYPMFMAQPQSGSLGTVKREIMKMIRKNHCKVICVDYLQLMDCGERSLSSRHMEIAKITRTLANIAKGHNVNILLLSQFNRRENQKGYPEPKMDWLAESSSIGNDSDVVLFIHRKHDSWDWKANPKTAELEPPEAKIIVAKNRNSRTGRFPIMFNTDSLRFVEPTNMTERLHVVKQEPKKETQNG